MTTETNDVTASYTAEQWSEEYLAEQKKGAAADTAYMSYCMERASAVANPTQSAMRAAFQATVQQQQPAAEADPLPNLTAYLSKCRRRCQRFTDEFRGK